MPTNQPHIASRVLNAPLLLEPAYARTFFSALSTRLGITQLTDAEGEVLLGEKMQLAASNFANARDRQRPYQIIDSIAVLPVSGTMVHKYGYVKPYSGMTGYDGIIARMEDAISDPEVKGILLDMDTPGGEVAGCFDAAQTIRQMAKQSGKPLWALADDMACSAGMAIASAADRRLITQSAVMGSVGVVMAHESIQQNLKQEGRVITLIHSGSHKVAGNPYQDLSAEVLASFQAKTDKLRDDFATLIASHMGLSKGAVLATEAAVYRGQEALDIGFADQLVNGNDAIGIFANYVKSPTTATSGVTMSAATVTEHMTDTPTLTAPLMSEKQRIKSIVKCQAATGLEGLAEHLAYDTDLSVEAATAILAAAPLAEAPDANSAQAHSDKLNELMNAEGNPNITDEVEQNTEAEQGVSKLTAAYKLTTAT